MEPALLVFTKVAVGVALAAPVAVRAWKRRRATRAARPATIGEALEGVPVRVVGRIVEAEATLQARPGPPPRLPACGARARE